MQFLRQHKVFMYSSLLALAGVAVLVVLFIFKPWVASSAQEAPVVFIRDNLLMMKQEGEQQPTELSGLLPENELVEAPELWRRLPPGNQWFRLNERRDRMFFVREITENEQAVLYYRDLTTTPTDGKPGVELASELSIVRGNFFEISTDGELVLYIKNYDEKKGGALFIHNLHKEALVGEKVIDYNYMDKPGVLYYTTLDEQNRKVVNMVKRSSLDKKTKVDTDILFITNTNPETGEIHYLKTASNGSRDLYRMLPGQSPVKLISNLEANVGDIHEESFFYRVNEPTDLTLYSGVTDDLEKSDAAIKEPNSKDYKSVERRSMINYWTRELYEADVEMFDQSGFDEANRLYQEKVKRDSLRRELKARSFDSISNGSLHYFSGGKSIDIADRWDRILLSDAKTGMVIYQSADYATAPKVPLSEVEFPEQLEAKYEEKLLEAAETYIFTPSTGTVKLDKDSGSLLVHATLSLDGQKLYGIEKGRELVSFDLEKGLPVHRKLLDENVYTFKYIEEGKEKLYYLKNSSGGSTLHVYTDGVSHQIATDFDYSLSKYYPKLDEFYYLTAYDSDERAGTLYRYRDGKSVKISDNVHDFYYNESSGLYYITNYDRSLGTGDLMHDDSGKPEQVANRVRFMIAETNYETF